MLEIWQLSMRGEPGFDPRVITDDTDFKVCASTYNMFRGRNSWSWCFLIFTLTKNIQCHGKFRKFRTGT